MEQAAHAGQQFDQKWQCPGLTHSILVAVVVQRQRSDGICSRSNLAPVLRLLQHLHNRSDSVCIPVARTPFHEMCNPVNSRGKHDPFHAQHSGNCDLRPAIDIQSTTWGGRLLRVGIWCMTVTPKHDSRSTSNLAKSELIPDSILVELIVDGKDGDGHCHCLVEV